MSAPDTTDKYMCAILRADGSGEPLIQDTPPTLNQYQEAVGGFIEPLRTPDNLMMFVNEEARIHGLPVNVQATAIVDRGFPIFGDVIICLNFEPE